MIRWSFVDRHAGLANPRRETEAATPGGAGASQIADPSQPIDRCEEGGGVGGAGCGETGIPLSFPSEAQRAANAAIHTEVPGHMEGYSNTALQLDRVMGLDKFARAALDTFKDGACVTVPSGNFRELRSFFSEANYLGLLEEAERASGFPVLGESLWESMLLAFATVKPRSDPTDGRRSMRDEETTASYVSEMNEIVLKRVVRETVLAQHHVVRAQQVRRRRMAGAPDRLEDSRAHRLVPSAHSCEYLTISY